MAVDNRMFDFPYNPARYSFDSEEILAALPEGVTAEKIDALLGRVFVCDLGLDKVALLDKNNKLLKIVDISDKLDNADKETADRFVILREGAPKPVFAEFVEFLLTGENKKPFLIPRGFAHGFLVLSESAMFAYKCDEFYHPEDEDGIIWNDPDIGIDWGDVSNVILSEKDQKHPLLKQSKTEFIL